MDDRLYDAADEAAMNDSQRELVDVLAEAAKHLPEDDVALLCWGCGIDRRLVPTRRLA